MKFEKYHSIIGADKQRMITAIVDAGYSKQHYMVTEKIHGANFGIHADVVTKEMGFSRRSGFLEEGEVFYAHTKWERRFVQSMATLVAILKDQAKVDIVVRGEIFGGGFYGQRVEGHKQVQKEVQYSPKTEFMAFAIQVDGEYLTPIESHVLLHNAEFPVVPVLGIFSTLQEAMDVTEHFESLVPAKLGYEAQEGNWAEGTVIEPMDEIIYMGNGKRLILKNKDTAFKEKKGKKATVKSVELSTRAHEVLDMTLPYLSDSRLQAVISKEPEIVPKDFGKIMGLFVQDALEEFVEDSLCLESMPFLKKAMEDDWKSFLRVFQKEATIIVRQHWPQTF